MLFQYKLAVLILCAILGPSYAAEPNPNWWKNAVFYQIYPRSFKDSGTDGIGDINGIISKLDHLVNLGVTAAWLSPIYKSPQADQGYDISDFKDINPEYGTLANFDSLIKAAHDKGIKIIMDFVPNHSSDEHDWFKKSAGGDVDFKDFYVWRDGVDGKPPNNWLSVFKGSAWTLNTDRNQYYLHQFAYQQPDLNYNNPKVVEEMELVLKFWLDRGVDGFRMDAVPFLFEDQSFADEPRSNWPNTPSDNHGYLRHVYTQHQPKTLDMIYKFRKYLDKYNTDNPAGDPRIMMTEAYADFDTIMYYYGNEQDDGAHFTFNFFLITDLNKNSNARDIVALVQRWIKTMPTKYISNWVLGNHDNNRVATRFGPDNVDGFNMLIALLPGIMVTYNGEEIGQEDGKVTFEQGKDPNACSAPKEQFESITRDVARTPFQWDATTSAGFSTSPTTWLPVSDKYKTNNLAIQSTPNTKSHYNIYKDLVQLRKNDAIKSGTLNIRAATDDVLVFSRKPTTGNTYITIFNVGAKDATISVPNEVFSGTQYLKVEIASVNSARKKGDLISPRSLLLKPHESLVAVSTSDVPNTTPTPTVKPTGVPTGGVTGGVTSAPTSKPNGACAITPYFKILLTVVCIMIITL